MTSPYLNQPLRSEAEVTLAKCEAIRAAVETFKTHISKRINEVGGRPTELLDYIDDGLGEALCGVERDAQNAIEEDEYRIDCEHIASERAYLGFKGWGK